MIDPQQKFISQLEDKKFLANKANRAENTDKIVKKLDELKPNTETKSAQDAMSAFVQMLKGDKGQDGKTPIYKEDYLTPDELDAIKEELRPKKGIDYFDGQDGQAIKGEKGDDGETPDKEELIAEVLNRVVIPEPIPGKDGADGKDFSGSFAAKYTIVPLASTTYTIATSTDNVIYISTTTAASTINLPACLAATDQIQYIVKDKGGNAGTQNITVTATGGGTIDNASTEIINANFGSTKVQCVSSGTWFTLP